MINDYLRRNPVNFTNIEQKKKVALALSLYFL